MKSINRILLCAAILSFSLSVHGKKLRRSARLDKCELYYNRAMRTTNLHVRMRCLQDAMAHARSKEQKVRILIREAYTHHGLGNKELALTTVEKGLKLSLSSKLEEQLMAVKITLSQWYGIKDEKLVSAAQKLIYDSDYKNAYTLYYYIARHYLDKKQYQQAFDLYRTLERRATKDSNAYHLALINQISIAGNYLKRTYDVGMAVKKMERSNVPSDLLSQLYYHAGKAYRANNDNAQAMKYFDKSIENHTQYYTCLSLMEKGKLLKEMKKTDDALKCFTQAQAMTKYSPHQYSAAMSIADIHREKKNYDEAISVIETAIKKY